MKKVFFSLLLVLLGFGIGYVIGSINSNVHVEEYKEISSIEKDAEKMANMIVEGAELAVIIYVGKEKINWSLINEKDLEFAVFLDNMKAKYNGRKNEFANLVSIKTKSKKREDGYFKGNGEKVNIDSYLFNNNVDDVLKKALESIMLW